MPRRWPTIPKTSGSPAGRGSGFRPSDSRQCAGRRRTAQPRIGGPVISNEMSDAFKPESPSAPANVFPAKLVHHLAAHQPAAGVVTFDAPCRAVSHRPPRADRQLSFQALILLNGVQYVEAARVLGQRVFYQDARRRAPRMIQLGFLRPASAASPMRRKWRLSSGSTASRKRILPHPKEAKQLLKVGRAPCDAKIPPRRSRRRRRARPKRF